MNIKEFVNKIENEIKYEFSKIEDVEQYFSEKILECYKNNNVNESCFNSTTGYGYNDYGRETIEKVFANLFGSESAIVRSQFVSGSHALTVTLFAMLRPNDLLLSISGTPYDTLHEVIGIKENNSSLKSFGIKYDQIDLIDNDFDYKRIEEYIKNNKVKVIEIQRSRGYSSRSSLTIEKIKKVIELIKSIDNSIIVMIDNCYCEMVEKTNPIEVGADICVGSLIKNLGAGIAPNGAYVVGKRNLIELVGERLTLPGEGLEVGPTLGINKSILQGLFMAPSVVASSMKNAILVEAVMEKLGYEVSPKYNENHADIVTAITFNDKDKLIKFVQGIQLSSPVDSNVLPIPSYMPGYDDDVIMASGSFTQGSSIELSCDAPIREPYIAYLQGGLTYNYGKIAIINAIERMMANE